MPLVKNQAECNELVNQQLMVVLVGQQLVVLSVELDECIFTAPGFSTGSTFFLPTYEITKRTE